jgi:hypothetical protein
MIRNVVQPCANGPIKPALTDNVFENNHAAGSTGTAFWIALCNRAQTDPLSPGQTYNTNRLNFQSFANNTAHSIAVGYFSEAKNFGDPVC